MFQDLLKGSRLEGVVGFQNNGVPYKYAPDYRYVEIQMETPVLEEGETKFRRNQSHVLRAAGTIQIAERNRILVSINPDLMYYANCPSMFMEEAGVRKPIQVPVQFRRDMPVDRLEWLVRIYLLGM